MPPLSDRTNTPISTEELERRWSAIRAAMADRKIDALLMQSTNDGVGGYVKYFTDQNAGGGYPVTIVFPRDDRMTMVCQGAFGQDDTLPAEGDGVRRGIKRILGTPSFASADYSLAYDAELTQKALEPYRNGTIGLLGYGSLPISLMDRLRKNLSGVSWVDAGPIVDPIKVRKSPEELQRIRGTAAMQDKVIDIALRAVTPGKREIDIGALAEYQCRLNGSEQGLFLVCSHQPGRPSFWFDKHNQNRVLQKGDWFNILVETNGPGGYWAEISRPCVIGKATQQMKDEFAFILEARRFTLNMARAGASCRDVWNEYNAFLRKNGKSEERRLYFHGQGYDLVERPLVRADEPMLIAKTMNFACHPTYISGGLFMTICDNYVIDDQGVPQHVHTYPERILELE